MFLRPLGTKEEVDAAIRGTADKIVVLRFGRKEDLPCMQLDDVVRPSPRWPVPPTHLGCFAAFKLFATLPLAPPVAASLTPGLALVCW